MDDELVDVTVSAESAEWLADFTRGLVEARLVACGNIVPAIRSIYRWEGAIEDDAEALVILHTRRARVAQLIERTNQEHPYDTPQVLVVTVVAATPAYHQWVLEATADENDR